MAGRQSMKIIRMFLDQEATKPTSAHSGNIFGDLFSSQKTPVHFPCLMTTFRLGFFCKFIFFNLTELVGVFSGLSDKQIWCGLICVY